MNIYLVILKNEPIIVHSTIFIVFCFLRNKTNEMGVQLCFLAINDQRSMIRVILRKNAVLGGPLSDNEKGSLPGQGSRKPSFLSVR